MAARGKQAHNYPAASTVTQQDHRESGSTDTWPRQNTFYPPARAQGQAPAEASLGPAEPRAVLKAL